MNIDTYESLQAAGFDSKQAAVLAMSIPDVDREFSALRAALRGDMQEMQGSLIRWMIGIFLAFTTLMGGLLAVYFTLISQSVDSDGRAPRSCRGRHQLQPRVHVRPGLTLDIAVIAALHHVEGCRDAESISQPGPFAPPGAAVKPSLNSIMGMMQKRVGDAHRDNSLSRKQD